MSQHRVRDHLPLVPRPEKYFRWRGEGVSRIEGFADSFFAFAVTLLIVALEVPRTFSGLVEALRSFPAFVVCFAFLMLFWNSHYRYFRRYGLEDKFSRFITIVIMLLVLFSVYPLKFLFGAILSFGAAQAPHIETAGQLKLIYRIYGLGFACIWGLYALLEAHAMKLRDALQLTSAELLTGRESLLSYLLNVAVCLLSVTLSCFDVPNALPGFVYMILGPVLTWNGMWHGRLIRQAAEQPAAS